MRNLVTVTDTDLIIDPQGLDRIWSFSGTITIPWSHVRGATHDPGVKKEPKGWRGPGLRMGHKLSGTFHADGERHFWNVSGYEDTVVIELLDEHFSRIAISVDNPTAQAAAINARAAAR